MRTTWTRKEEKTLKLLYGTMPLQQLADVMNKTYAEVSWAGRKLGLRKKHKKYSKKDILFIKRQFYKRVPVKKIAEHFDVDYQSVYAVIKKRGWRRIRPNYYCAVSAIKEKYFYRIDTPTKAYLLGFLAADGNVLDCGRIQIQLNKKDICVLELFRKELSPKRRIAQRKNTVSMAFPSKRLCADLAKYGIVPRKTKTFKWPKLLPKKYEREFILGYFDGDGSLYTSGNGLQWSLVGNKIFLKRTNRIIYNNLGISSRITLCSNYTWRIRYCRKEDILKLDKWLHDSPAIKKIGLRRKTTQRSGLNSVMGRKSYLRQGCLMKVR